MVRLIRRLRDEFSALPGLRLTEAQVQRLCSVDAATCASGVRALVSAGFLRSREDGVYERSDLASSTDETRARVRQSPWRRILCLVEFDDDTTQALSPASRSALRYATTLAVTHRARVTALHVVQQDRPLAQVSARLRQSVSSNAFRKLIDVHVAMGTPHEEVLRMATETEVDLIVLGRGDHTRTESLPRLREVLRDAPCPVVIVHPAGQVAVA